MTATTFVCAALAVMLVCVGCASDAATTDGAGQGGKDTSIGFAGADSIVAEDAGTKTSGDASIAVGDVPPKLDTAGSPVASVDVTMAGKLQLGAAVDVVIKAVRLDGKSANLAGVVFEADGKPVQIGANLTPEAAKAVIAVWKHDDAATWRIAATRPGKTNLVVRVGGVASKPIPIDVQWPTTPTVRVSQPGAQAVVEAQRQLDDANTIRIGGKSAGKGGGTVTLRFPLATKSATVLDIEKSPSKGGLSVTGAFADLGGAKFTLAKGYLSIDQTGKGQLRGTFSGLAASLKPIAGVFVVERKGKFGIDLIDDKPVVIGTSDAPTPQTGSHFSRVSVGGFGGKLVVLNRTIEGKFKADLSRHAFSPGPEAAKPVAPVMDDATAYTGLKDGQPGPFNAAIGYAAIQPLTQGYLVVWEGRSKKGHSQPHGIWARAYDDDHKPVSNTATVATDPCHGQCAPVVASTTGGTVIGWNTTGGGVSARGINGLIKAAKLSFMQSKPVELVAKGAGVQMATIAGKTVATWHDGAKVRWSMGSGGGNWGVKHPIASTDTMTPPAALAGVKQGGGGFFVLLSCVKGKLRTDKISLSAAPLGKPAFAGDCYGDRYLAAAGADGQVVVVERQPGNATYIIRARKLRWVSQGSDPELLGGDVTLAKVITGTFIRTVLSQAPATHTFIVGWAGDLDSAGVFVRRFR